MDSSKTQLLTDKQWSVIDGEVCRATDFDDTISHLNKSMPYVSITIECVKLPNKAKGFITHKIDFLNLQKAFNDPLIKEGLDKQYTEVIFTWTKKHYKNKVYSLFSHTMPKLIVMICPKGAFELMTDQNYKPELQGEARFLAEKPIVEFKPEVMK